MPMSGTDEQIARLLEELDRLEDLVDDLNEFGLRTIEDVERRIAEINTLIDQLAPQ